MKLRAPEMCQAVSHQGRQLAIAEDRSVEVDDDDWSIFSTHGFRPWRADPTIANNDAMSRNELVTQVVSSKFKTLDGIGTEEIRTTRLNAANKLAPSENHVAMKPMTTSDVDIKTISALNRFELFAFLRSKGVSVSLPVTNAELRAVARRALG